MALLAVEPVALEFAWTGSRITGELPQVTQNKLVVLLSEVQHQKKLQSRWCTAVFLYSTLAKPYELLL